MSFKKVGNAKENSRMHQKASLIGLKASKHSSMDHKSPRKLPSEFKSPTKFLIKYSIMEGLPHGSKTQMSSKELIKPPHWWNQHKFPSEP